MAFIIISNSIRTPHPFVNSVVSWQLDIILRCRYLISFGVDSELTGYLCGLIGCDCLLIPATITVFINGVTMEVPRGPIDLRAMLGQDVMLVHSTGALLPVNDYGILTQSLQMGESYFLVISHIASLIYSLHSKF